MRTRRADNQGLAISTILLAVVLLAAIAVMIAMSSRSGNASSSEQQDRLLASTLLHQAQTFRTGFDMMQANGVDIQAITFDTASGTGLWGTDGTIVYQYPPAAALTSTASDWGYKNSSGQGNVQLMNIGTPAGPERVIQLNRITKGVCQQVNQLLYGATTIPKLTAPSGTFANWDTDAASIDLSADPATDSRPEGCVEVEDQAVNVYYKTVSES
jgi:hypothetical protein